MFLTRSYQAARTPVTNKTLKPGPLGRTAIFSPIPLRPFSSLKTSSVLSRRCCRAWEALPSTSLRVQSASCFLRTDSTQAAVVSCPGVPSHPRAMKRLFPPGRVGQL